VIPDSPLCSFISLFRLIPLFGPSLSSRWTSLPLSRRAYSALPFSYQFFIFVSRGVILFFLCLTLSRVWSIPPSPHVVEECTSAPTIEKFFFLYPHFSGRRLFRSFNKSFPSFLLSECPVLSFLFLVSFRVGILFILSSYIFSYFPRTFIRLPSFFRRLLVFWTFLRCPKRLLPFR